MIDYVGKIVPVDLMAVPRVLRSVRYGSCRSLNEHLDEIRMARVKAVL
jgi:hypothetical protein